MTTDQTAKSHSDKLEWMLLGIAIGNEKSHEHIQPSDFSNTTIRGYFVDLVISQKKKRKTLGLRSLFVHFASRIQGLNVNGSDKMVLIELCRANAHNSRIVERTKSVNMMLQWAGNDNDVSRILEKVEQVKQFVQDEEDKINAQVSIEKDQNQTATTSEPGTGQTVSA